MAQNPLDALRPQPAGSLQDEQIAHAASMAGVPLEIAKRLVQAESSGNPRAVSPTGAQGLTQLEPATAKELSVSDPFDPAENLAGGLKYLAQLHKQFGSWGHALAAYNWGPGNVQQWLARGGDFAKLPAETRAYIQKIAPAEVAALTTTPFRQTALAKRRSHLQLLGETAKGTNPLDALRSSAQPSPSPNPLDALKQTDPAQSGAAHLAPPLFQQWAQGLEQHGLGPYAHALRSLDDAAQHPLSILNAVLGAPQRFVAGAVGAEKNPYDNPITDPGMIGAGLYGVTHPNDPQVQGGLEHALGADKLKALLQQRSPGNTGYAVDSGAVPHRPSTGNDTNFAVDLATQTLTDPLMGLGKLGATAHAGDTLIQGLSDATTHALLNHPSPAVRRFVASFVAHPELRRGFTPSGRAIVKGVINSESGNAAKQAAADADLLAKHKTQLASGQVPPEVEQRLLRDAYVYGTPELRQQAVEHGYQPTADEAAHPPEGVLKYDLKQDYFPHYGQREFPKDFTLAGQTTQRGAPYAGFEQPQEGALRSDPLESMRLRLNNARSVIQHRMTQKRIGQETGLQAGEYGVLTDPEKLQQYVTNDTAAAYNVMDNPRPPEIAGLPGMKEVGNLGRDVMISTNPIPHSKNIGILSYLAGGVPGLMKGLQYAMSGVPKALADRLDHIGAGGHFMLTQPGKLSTARLVPGFIRKGTQAALDRVDAGMRAARLEQLDREFPAMSEYEKGERVNEDIGAYRDSPAYVQLLRNVLGAQFPQWHGYIVPTAVSRAILRHPERVEQLIRTQDTGNHDFLGNQPYSIEMGGPVSEFGSLTQAPGEALTGKQPNFFTSPSMIGPVASEVSHMAGQSQSYNPPGVPVGGQQPPVGGTLLDQILPYFSAVAPQIGYNPYGSKAPPNVRSIAAFFAAYPKAKESAMEQMIRDRMEQQHLTRFQAQRAVQKLWRTLYRYNH